MRFLIGIGYKITSIAFFVAMMALVKVLAPEIPIGEIIFFRGILGILPVMVVYWLRGEIVQALRISNGKALVLWAFCAAFAMIFWFVALTLIPLPVATVLSLAAPLMMVILAGIYLGEKVGIYRYGAVIFGFVGVFIILWPRLSEGASLADGAALGVLLALISTFLWSSAQVVIRKLTATDSTLAIVLSFSLLTALLALCSMPFGWVMPDVTQSLLLVACSLFGGIGQIMISEAFRYAEASLLAPFDYLLLVFATIVGIIFFNEYPDDSLYFGAPLVVLTGLFIIYRERKLEKAKELKKV